jgi:hypothetical protein
MNDSDKSSEDHDAAKSIQTVKSVLTRFQMEMGILLAMGLEAIQLLFGKELA